MAVRRINRSSPALLTVREQETFIREVERRPAVLKGLETLLGVTWDELNFQQKVQAAQDYQESGKGAAVMAQVARAWMDLEQLGQAANGNLSLADELTRAQEQIEQLQTENDALRQRDGS